jgi:hypothetical protein
MSHARKLIRDAVETTLTGLASTATRVYANRLYALADADLPALRVYMDSETVEELTLHRPAEQERRLRLVVECCAKSNTTLDDKCDQMQLEVENALYAGISVGGKTLYPQLTGSAYDDAIGLTPVAVKRVAFSIDYFTLANAPDSLI